MDSGPTMLVLLSLFWAPCRVLSMAPVPNSTWLSTCSFPSSADFRAGLAHKVARLMLSHRTETLSSATIIVPAIIIMAADKVRSTVVSSDVMFFGPFFNDTTVQPWKVAGKLNFREYCTGARQEIEADIVSTRLLVAHWDGHPRTSSRSPQRRS